MDTINMVVTIENTNLIVKHSKKIMVGLNNNNGFI